MVMAHFIAVTAATYVPEDDGPPPTGATGPHQYWRIRSGFNLSQGGALQLSELAFKSLGVDVTTGGTPIYSSQFNSSTAQAANAFDKNTGTSWQGNGEAAGMYLGYRFAAGTQVDSFSEAGSHFDATRNPKNMLIEYSDDGVTWTLAQDYNDPLGNLTAGAYRTITITPVDYYMNDNGAHRYWRVRPILYPAQTSGIIIEELQFLGIDNTDLAVGGTAIESAHQGTNAASGAFNKSTSNFWQALNGFSASWLGYDFGTAKKVQKVGMRVGSSAIGWPLSFVVEFSDNGSDWTPCDLMTYIEWTSQELKVWVLNNRIGPSLIVTRASRNIIMKRKGPNVSKVSRQIAYRRKGPAVAKLARYIIFKRT